MSRNLDVKNPILNIDFDKLSCSVLYCTVPAGLTGEAKFVPGFAQTLHFLRKINILPNQYFIKLYHLNSSFVKCANISFSIDKIVSNKDG